MSRLIPVARPDTPADALDARLGHGPGADRGGLEPTLAHAARMQAVGELAGGIAHDFNNLLTAVLGHAELALEQAHARPGLEADLHEIVRAAERAHLLTGQLLAVGRRSLLRPRPVDLPGLVAGLEPVLRRLVGDEIRLVVQGGGTPAGSVVVDPALLEHALVNLVVNARDATPVGGVVRVTSGGPEPADDAPDGPWVALRVEDGGRGITQEVLDRVFAPFSTTEPPGGGTGLGLAMVHGFVEQSGGHLRVRTGPATGTRFTVLLPAIDESVASPPDGRYGTLVEGVRRVPG